MDSFGEVREPRFSRRCSFDTAGLSGKVCFQHQNEGFLQHVGIAEINQLLPFLGDGERVGNHVHFAAGQRGDQRAEFQWDKFDLQLLPLGKITDHLDIKTDIFAIDVGGNRQVTRRNTGDNFFAGGLRRILRHFDFGNILFEPLPALGLQRAIGLDVLQESIEPLPQGGIFFTEPDSDLRGKKVFGQDADFRVGVGHFASRTHADNEGVQLAGFQGQTHIGRSVET